MKNTYRTLGNPSGTVSIVKAFSLLVGVLLFCMPLSAQKLTVESLEYVPNDAAAASYETQMQDINGNFAGVVKVHIALDNVQFEGGGVLKQEKRGTNEYWVWMAQGSNRLKVIHPNFLPLEVSFRMYDEVKIVKSKLTYKLVITVPKAEDVQKQKFTLRYTPADAIVVIDDNIIQGINGVYEDELPVGDHSYSIIKTGYAVDKGTFSLLPSAPKRLIVELEKLQEAKPVAQTTVVSTLVAQTTAVSTPVAQPAQPVLSNSQPQLSSENAENAEQNKEQTVAIENQQESERVTPSIFPQHFDFFWFIMHPGGYMPNTKVSLEEFKQRANSSHNGHNMYTQLNISEQYPHMVNVKFNPSHNSNQIISDKYVFMPDSINSTVCFEEDKKDRIGAVFYDIYFRDASRAKGLVSKWNTDLKKYARKEEKGYYNYSWGKYADHSFQSVNILAPFYTNKKNGEHLVSFYVYYYKE